MPLSYPVFTGSSIYAPDPFISFDIVKQDLALLTTNVESGVEAAAWYRVAGGKPSDINFFAGSYRVMVSAPQRGARAALPAGASPGEGDRPGETIKPLS